MMPVFVFSTTSSRTLIRLFFVFSLWLFIPQHCLIMAQLTYLKTICSPNTTNHTMSNQFQSNLKRLLIRSLYNNAVDSIFSNVTQGDDPDKAYGLFLCRGDLQPSACQNCIDAASDQIVKDCPLNKEAITWYDECLIRYSYRSFFSTMETDPVLPLANPENVTEPVKFNESLKNSFSNLSIVATSSNPWNPMYASSEVDVTSLNYKLYSMVQCTPNLSPSDCRTCLNFAVSQLLSLFGGKPRGGRVLTPSCNIRYELYQFLQDPPVAAQPPTPNSDGGGSGGGGGGGSNGGNNSGNKRNTSVTFITTVTLLAAILAILLIFVGNYLVKKKIKTSREATEDVASTSYMDSLQFDFGTIRDATNNFSDANKLGEGGFGPVYKGVLLNGQEIAVKKLSGNSRQGQDEFKNEVVLLATLSHRNLVSLLGFCFEGNEKLLIYEFMPNKSLDHFIFDHVRRERLDWKSRNKIIQGFARGLLYLHEDSQHQIIHRDLKASNILLDANMNPKISDFGTARLMALDQSHYTASKIMGTHGYMAPEYLKYGRFSVKSDVFSFGVIMLEILSGQKIFCFHDDENVENLLSYAWKNWRNNTALDIVDSTLMAYPNNEIMACIHIGLLCVQENAVDRPTMALVVSMLASSSFTLSLPSHPAFLLSKRLVRGNSLHESNSMVTESDQSEINLIEQSINEVTNTDFVAR